MKHFLALILAVAFALPAWGQWVSIYNITYIFNCGANDNCDDGSYPATYSDTSSAIVLKTPTRSGYTFNGWYSDYYMSEGPISSIPAGSSGSKTFYASWTINRYTITFDATGGSGSPESGSTNDYWRLPSLPASPTRSGYYFEGWFTAPTGGTQITTSTVFNSNATIYAQWSPIYTVTFDGNDFSTSSDSRNTAAGGKLSSLPTFSSASTKIFSESFEYEDVEIENNGWVFVNGSQENKWFINGATQHNDSYSAYISNDNGTSNNYSSTYNSTVHLYKDITFPVSATDFILTFYFKGYGYYSYDYMTVRYSTTSYTPSDGSIFSDGNLLGSYYGYSGWSQQTMTLPASAFSGKTMRLVFTWQNSAYSSYNSNPPAAIDDIAISRTDYYFEGWFTEATGGTQITTSTVFDANTTVYAQCSPIYTVTFNTNGGSALSTSSGTTGSSRKLTSLPTPTRDGYAFNGWYTAATGGTAVTTDYVFNANTTIYAQWTINNPTFIYENFSTTSTTSGLTYSGMGRVTSGGVDSSACLKTSSAGGTGTVTINNVTLGVNGKLSFYFGVTDSLIGYSSQLSITKSDGTILISPGTGKIGLNTFDLSSLSNQRVSVQISVNNGTSGYAYLDDITIMGARYAITFNPSGGTVTPASDTTAFIPSSGIGLSESFENGANGWVLVNGSYTNKWVIGTATKYSGSYSAYISNNNGTSNSYSDYSGTAVHIYKDITFPVSATNFTLTFYYKGYGESGCDYMTVGYSTTDVTPVAGSTSGISSLGTYMGYSNWTLQTITLPAATFSGRTIRLIFTWVNDGSVNNPPPAAIDDIIIPNILNSGGVTSLSLPTPTRSGYAFEGWFTAATGGTQVYTSTAFTANSTIYAQWSPSYTITFNAGDSATVTPATSPTGAGKKLDSLPTPIKSGFAFQGWYTTTNSSNQITTNTVFSSDSTIYARWAPVYTITFDATGGTVTPETRTTGTDFKLVSLPTPTRSGYKFEGWFTSATVTDTTTQITTNTVFRTNTTIYAIWTPIYTITFNANGGTVMPMETFENGTNGWVLVNGSQTNKWVIGTATKYAGSYSAYISNDEGVTNYYNTSYSSTVHLYKDITFPVSATNFTLTFYFKGYGYGSNYDYMTVRYSDTSYTPVAGSAFSSGTQIGTTYYQNSSWTQKTISLPAATFSGKTMRLVFTWINASTGAGSYYQPPAAIDDINIPGVGTSISTYTDSTITGGVLPSLPTPTRAGYSFNGWYTAETEGTLVNTSTVFSANATIYAQWTINSYTVTFDANGGSLSSSSGRTGEGWKLSSLPTPTRSGYSFIGWYTTSTTTDGTEVTTNTVFSGNTTIYAKWLLAITITPSTLPEARKGERYDQSLYASTSPVTWSISSGALPTGLTLSSNGTISGTPTVAGIFNFTVKAENSTSNGTNNYSIRVTTGSGSTAIFEDFENGANGWVLVNGSQTNKWVIGTATKYAGSYSAYISNNNGTSNSYSDYSGTAVHIYKDITFPVSATNFTLTFYYKGYGESGCDYMTVGYSSTGVTPVAGSTSGISSLGTYMGYSNWTLQTITLPAATFSGRTIRLIFTWVNDGSVNNPPPAAIDNISISGASADVVPAPVITTTSLPIGIQGIAYNSLPLELEERGMPAKWSVTTGTLPAGLAIDSITGAISGTPTTVGTSTFTVTANNGETNGNGAKSLSIQVVSVDYAFEQLKMPIYIIARDSFALSATIPNSTQALTWRIENAGSTGATISSSTLNTTSVGTIIVTVAIDEINKRSFTIMVLPVGSVAISKSYSPLVIHSPQYYTLRGTPLGANKPAAPGVYIEKRGYVSKKIVVH